MSYVTPLFKDTRFFTFCLFKGLFRFIAGSIARFGFTLLHSVVLYIFLKTNAFSWSHLCFLFIFLFLILLVKLNDLKYLLPEGMGIVFFIAYFHLYLYLFGFAPYYLTTDLPMTSFNLPYSFAHIAASAMCFLFISAKIYFYLFTPLFELVISLVRIGKKIPYLLSSGRIVYVRMRDSKFFKG